MLYFYCGPSSQNEICYRCVICRGSYGLQVAAEYRLYGAVKVLNWTGKKRQTMLQICNLELLRGVFFNSYQKKRIFLSKLYFFHFSNSYLLLRGRLKQQWFGKSCFSCLLFLSVIWKDLYKECLWRPVVANECACYYKVSAIQHVHYWKFLLYLQTFCQFKLKNGQKGQF